MSPVKVHSSIIMPNICEDKVNFSEKVYDRLLFILSLIQFLLAYAIVFSIMGFGEPRFHTILQTWIYIWSASFAALFVFVRPIESEDALSLFSRICRWICFSKFCLILAHVIYYVVLAQLIYTPIICMFCELAVACTVVKLRIHYAPLEYEENKEQTENKEKMEAIEERKTVPLAQNEQLRIQMEIIALQKEEIGRHKRELAVSKA